MAFEPLGPELPPAWGTYLSFTWENQKFRLDKPANGSRHSVWESSENMGCDLRRCNFSTHLIQWV